MTGDPAITAGVNCNYTSCEGEDKLSHPAIIAGIDGNCIAISADQACFLQTQQVLLVITPISHN